MPYSHVIGWMVEMTNGEEELSVEWVIHDVLSLPGGSEDAFISPEFQMGDRERFYLRLWPKWMNESWNPASGWLRLSLLRIGGAAARVFRIRVGMKASVEGGVVRESEVESVISRFGSHDWRNFCSRFALIEHKSRLMDNNILTITCFMKMVPPDSIAGNGELSAKGKFLGSGAASNLGSKMQGMEKALGDFGRLLSSGEGSDLTIKVADFQFKVHRLVLTARSPVFSAMFSHDTAERTSSTITIDDCEPGVFEKYLRYLYTGSFGDSLSKQDAFHLYRVADKYLAEELKHQCLRKIQEGLSVQTFCDAVQLALGHNEGELLEKAIAFASENIFLDSFYFKQNLLV